MKTSSKTPTSTLNNTTQVDELSLGLLLENTHVLKELAYKCLLSPTQALSMDMAKMVGTILLMADSVRVIEMP